MALLTLRCVFRLFATRSSYPNYVPGEVGSGEKVEEEEEGEGAEEDVEGNDYQLVLPSGGYSQMPSTLVSRDNSCVLSGTTNCSELESRPSPLSQPISISSVYFRTIM